MDFGGFCKFVDPSVLIDRPPNPEEQEPVDDLYHG
jgi:hypothetical protein